VKGSGRIVHVVVDVVLQVALELPSLLATSTKHPRESVANTENRVRDRKAHSDIVESAQNRLVDPESFCSTVNSLREISDETSFSQQRNSID